MPAPGVAIACPPAARSARPATGGAPPLTGPGPRGLRLAARLARAVAAGKAVRRVAIVGGSVLLGVTVTLWSLVLVQNHRQHLEAQETEARRLEAIAHSIEESVRHVLAVADGAAQSAGRAIAAGQDPDEALRLTLQYASLDSRFITAVRYLNVQGTVRAQRLTRPSPGPATTLQPHHDSVRAHLGDAGLGLFVSRTFWGERSGTHVFALSRRVEEPDGALRGIVQVAIDAEYLGRLFQRIGRDMGVGVALIGDDAAMRVRVSTTAGTSYDDRLDAAHPLSMLLRSGQREGRVRARGQFETEPLMLASRRLDGFPLSVGVASRVQAIDARNASERRLAIVALGVTTALLWSAFALGIGILARSARYRTALGVALRRSRTAERAKTRLLGSLSHELRTPLTAILGFSSLIERRAHEPHVQQMAGTVRKSAQHLNLLLTQVLDAARAEAGALTVTIAPEPVREIVADACALFAPAAEAKGVRLVAQIADPVPERLDCDGTRLRQVMNNLLSNAVKFTEQGLIRVSMRVDGGQLRIEVADTGPGIPASAHERVFERFRQADDRVSRTHGGSGLGLGLARAFARRMGGDVRLASVEGEGTTVTVTLPLAAADPDARAHGARGAVEGRPVAGSRPAPLDSQGA